MASQTPPSGTFAGRYTIERELGRGGTATVFLAHDTTTSTSVALKVLHRELVESVAAERFLREFRMNAGLRHPHIAPILNSGQFGADLFLVMPHMESGSLRTRLDKERQLSVESVVDIVRAIGSALQHAHERGLIHRDVKPENILFSDKEAYLSDFGIARAVERVAGDSTTSSGIVRGTPAYMSPEQASGDHHFDGRSDQYSFACVVYEMLAGMPAFHGPTQESTIALRFRVPPREISAYRPGVSQAIERVIQKAMSLAPADRYSNMTEFVKAFDAAVTLPAASVRRVRTPRTPLLFAGLALVLALGWLTTRPGGWLEDIGIINPKLDTTIYIVVPVDSAALDASDALWSRLSRWSELTLVDRSVVAEAARQARGTTAQDRGHVVAASLRAGRYLRVRSARVRDSIEVSAALFDTRTDTRLIEKTLRFANFGAAAGLIDALADSMLFRSAVVRVPRPQGRGGTNFVSSRQAFLRGQAALEEGDFLRADSAFFTATRIDPGDAQALIWLANVRSWMRNWKEHSWGQLTRQATQAVALHGPVASSDSVLLIALVALDAERWQDACSDLSSLTNINPFDYAAWYGLANCLGRDKGVLRDPATSGWRFRSSYERALRAYEQAFRLRSSMLRGFGGRSLGSLEDLFFTRGMRYREGVAVAPDTGFFRAVPQWQRDSLAFIPLRGDQALQGPWPDAQALAVQRQRERFHAISQMWRAEAPTSVDAAEALAISLELLGDAGALDTMRLARTLASTPNDRLRIAASEVLLRVKFSVPSDTVGLYTARALADSLLRTHSPSEHAETQLLGSLAGLTGHGLLAARYAAAGGVIDGVPSAIAQSGPALLAGAAMGASCDTLRALEDAVESSVATLPGTAGSQIRAEWLMRAAALAFPDCRLRTLSTAAQSHPHPDAQTELLVALGGNADAIRNGLAKLSRVRSTFRPAEIRMEGLLPGAAAFASIGDTQRAIDWLDPTLKVLRLSASQNLANVVQTGSLVRIMALRARLAERQGDTATARTWAKAVVILWSGGDPFLRSTLQEMERLAR